MRVSMTPEISYDWLLHALPRYLARLERLVAVDAPPLVIEWERKLIRRALDRLSPAQGLAILGSWRELHRHVERCAEGARTDGHRRRSRVACD
jgi:hypothetical protein